MYISKAEHCGKHIFPWMIAHDRRSSEFKVTANTYQNKGLPWIGLSIELPFKGRGKTNTHFGKDLKRWVQMQSHLTCKQLFQMNPHECGRGLKFCPEAMVESVSIRSIKKKDKKNKINVKTGKHEPYHSGSLVTVPLENSLIPCMAAYSYHLQHSG